LLLGGIALIGGHNRRILGHGKPYGSIRLSGSLSFS